MFKRLLCSALALAMTLLLIPMPAAAAAPDSSDLTTQIRDVYLAALRATNRYSFHGYCGSMVNWQLYLMGIDTQVYGRNGNDEYDLYASMDVTTGGYKVQRYPATTYTMTEALNAITENGTVDAYNLMVGFQWTHTEAGSRYGHAMVIHGIVDGLVYFSESYSTSLGGQYYPEGAPIVCDIDTFCDYYRDWTVFEGIIYFGLKSYAQVCDTYPAGMYAMAPRDLALYSEPCDPGIYDAAPTDRILEAGSVVKISSILRTPEGALWYEFRAEGMVAYLPVEDLVYHAECIDDVKAGGIHLPAALTAGNGYIVGGTVTTDHSRLTGVTVAVYPEGGSEPVFSGTLTGGAKYINLFNQQLDNQMTFRMLQPGSYFVEITADICSYVVKKGELIENNTAVKLWHSKLDVYDHWAYCPVVTVDANGGFASVQQISVEVGKELGRLPNPSRTGYIFTGWTLDPQGTQPVTEHTKITRNVTLYAQWEKTSYALSGWQYIDGKWQYFVAGSYVKGWFVSNGVQFYQDENGQFVQGLYEINGKKYYFSESGAMCTGWKSVDGGTYYFAEDGAAVTGVQVIDDMLYRFDGQGRVFTSVVSCRESSAGSVRLEVMNTLFIV